MDSPKKVLIAKDIWQIYQNGNEKSEILRGINLDLSAGQVSLIVGRSGSGKSTLLHLLAGLSKPTKGTIFWLEHNLSLLNSEKIANLRAEIVGLVFQHHYLLEDINVFENLMIPSLIQKRDLTKHALELLEKVGLNGKEKLFPQQLSGGERQRLALARALITKPAILFADEPTGSLDRANADNVFSLLIELTKEENVATLIATHDERFITQADQVFTAVL